MVEIFFLEQALVDEDADGGDRVDTSKSRKLRELTLRGMTRMVVMVRIIENLGQLLLLMLQASQRRKCVGQHSDKNSITQLVCPIRHRP